MSSAGRILIGGTSSGCGKTTVTCALLGALKDMGYVPSAFKCGPDYIDPMFHREMTGIKACSLDSFFCGSDTLRGLISEYSRDTDIAVIEGVMGFYDGESSGASGDRLCALTGTPALLVVDAASTNESLGAVIKGFLEYREGNLIRGVIFNRLSPSREAFARDLCGKLGTEYLGFLPKAGFELGSRRLGLITAPEVEDLRGKLRRLSDLASGNLRISRILEIAASAEALTESLSAESLGVSPAAWHARRREPLIAVSSDRAFCFMYQENLDLLKKLGCRIALFSPVSDGALPQGCSGLILCGGYPEIHAEALAANAPMLESIRNAAAGGMPCIAECGGFMYLHRHIVLEDGQRLALAGVIDADAYCTGRLRRFGYAELTAETDGMICEKGHTLRVHEFHYWESTACGGDFTARKADGRSWTCGYNTPGLYAGFPHLYFYSDPGAALRFADACGRYMHDKEI